MIMELVYANENNEESKEQKSGVFNEVSSDSNGMFEEQSKVERDTAGKQLYGAGIENKSESDVVSGQEQYNAPIERFMENVQPQNIAKQMPPAVTPQNVSIQRNQNEIMNLGFNQKEEQKERHHHRYCSIPCDDSIGCVTYIVKVNTNAENRVTMSEYSILLRKLRNEAKKDTVDIALMYINSVKDYDTRPCLKKE